MSNPDPRPATGETALISETSDQAFVQDVIAASQSQPVIVDFWAPWCAPCRTLTPILEAAVLRAGGAVRLVKLNVEDHPAIAQQLNVRSIPAVFAFDQGRPVDGFTGALPEAQIADFVTRLAGGGGLQGRIAGQIAAAQSAFEAGDLAQAASLFSEALAAAPGETAALAGLARCYIETGDLERAQNTLDLVPPAQQADQGVAAAQAALALAAKSRGRGASETAVLEARLADTPADHQLRFDLALALNAQGRKHDAVAALLEIIRRDRGWNDEAARRQLLEFFTAYGPEDEAAIEGRRGLSAILFS